MSILIILVLGCWAGLWAFEKLAQAQQNITISGRVTRPSGQAVQGAFVFLEKMSGQIFTDGQETNGNGSYQLSAPPGTYRLVVDPTQAPLIPQEIPNLILSTNIIRDFVLAEGFSLSGQVTDEAGTPVPEAFIAAFSDGQQISFGDVNQSGQYRFGCPLSSTTVPSMSTPDSRVILRTVSWVTATSSILFSMK